MGPFMNAPFSKSLAKSDQPCIAVFLIALYTLTQVFGHVVLDAFMSSEGVERIALRRFVLYRKRPGMIVSLMELKSRVASLELALICNL